MTIQLTNQQVKLLKGARTRHGRRRTDLSICEGLRCCLEAIHRRPEWVQFAVSTERFRARNDTPEFDRILRETSVLHYRVTEREFNGFAATANPQGILLVFRPEICHVRQLRDRGTDPFVLILDRITEPGNMGTILRTAWAVGLKKVWLTEGCVDPYAPKTVRAGMGAQFALEVIHGPCLSEVRDALQSFGIKRMWLSMPGAGISCCTEGFELRDSALVIGNEAAGTADTAGADRVRIPMPGDAESLNASQAATILLYEAVRRGVL